MCTTYLALILLLACFASFHVPSPAASAFFMGTMYAIAVHWTLPEHDPRPRLPFTLMRVLAVVTLVVLFLYSLYFLYQTAPIPTAADENHKK